MRRARGAGLKGRLVMEDKKDFDKDKQEKGTIVLFGHEFDKKKAVMAGLGGLLAIALIGGGVWYAASQKPEPKEPTPIEQTEKQEQHVIQLGAKADGWVKGESSPVIAHIVNKEEKVDYYHAYDANEPHALDVPAEGEYEVSFISPVDKDGSTYEVPKTAKVKSEVEEKDGKDAGDELPFEFKPIAADKADADALNAIVKSIGEAVKKGDETLTGAKGTKVIELVKDNAKANPNADKDKVNEESQKAEEGVTDEPSSASKPETGGSNGGSGSSGNSGSNGGSSNSGDGSKPQHAHNWVAETTTVYHDAVYETTYIHHDAIVEYRCICNGCHADITGFETSHFKENFFNGCQSYTNTPVTVQDAWDEPVQQLVKDAYYEEVPTGRKICTSCGWVE